MSDAVTIIMRLLTIMMSAILAGCSGSPTLEELEDEAIVAGDWSAVEERERLIEHKKKGKQLDCPSGSISVCFESGLTSDCKCVRAGP